MRVYRRSRRVARQGGDCRLRPAAGTSGLSSHRQARLLLPSAWISSTNGALHFQSSIPLVVEPYLRGSAIFLRFPAPHAVSILGQSRHVAEAARFDPPTSLRLGEAVRAFRRLIGIGVRGCDRLVSVARRGSFASTVVQISGRGAAGCADRRAGCGHTSSRWQRLCSNPRR